jgi:hypothetical protein
VEDPPWADDIGQAVLRFLPQSKLLRNCAKKSLVKIQAPPLSIEESAVEAWRQRDPEAWAKVLAWLRQRAVSVETIRRAR